MARGTYEVELDRKANEPISEGIHPFVIKDFEEDTGAKGPYWTFICECETPVEAGKTVRLYVSLSENARWRRELFFDAVGAPEKGTVTADRFVGRRFRSLVYHDTFEGRAFAKCGELYPPTAATASVPAVAPVAKKTAGAPTAPPATNNGAPRRVAAKAAPKGKLPKDVAKSGDNIPF